MLEGVGETPAGGPADAGADQNTPPVLDMVPLHWRRAVRIAWVTLALLYVGLFVAAIPFRYARIASLTTTALGQGQWSSATTTLTPAILRDALPALGLTPGQLAAYRVALECVRAAGFCAVGVVIFWRKSTEWMALFVSLLLVTFGVASGVVWQDLAAAQPVLAGLLDVLAAPVWPAFVILFYLFPDGRFVPRWTVGIAGCLLALVPIEAVDRLPTSVAIIVSLIGFGVAVFAQIYRYHRVSDLLQRQQTRWLMFAVSVLLGALIIVFVVLPALFPTPRVPASALLWELAGAAGKELFYLLIPVSIGIAILRYRLWDIDLLINRTLVYGALTGCVVGLYVLVIGSLSALFQARGNLLASLLATGLVAVLFHPLRARIQHAVNRLMYGERDDPYAVISRLGQRLEGTITPSAVLPTIVQTVREALKLPYVAIALKRGDLFPLAAAAGTPVKDILRLPLVYQNELVGQLMLGTRSPGEPFSPADRRLLDDLARQAGTAAHAVLLHDQTVRLSDDLQRSREQLVTAREEERRRLRRDLHDGLGPALASLTFKVDAARDELNYDIEAAATMLHGLKQDIQTAVVDIRRLVYALRPPALDDLGLVAALRMQAGQYRQGSLRITVDAPDSLPPLPAAVEVAAYRIASEALTNVTRHASAHTCCVRLRLAETLELEVLDDGHGLPADHPTGIGLVSMRERAAELGGQCVVERTPGGGTRVWANLPLGRAPITPS